MEALRKKERQDETQFTTKIDGFVSFPLHPLNANELFSGLKKMSPLFMTKLRVPVLSLPYFSRISLVCVGVGEGGGVVILQ